MAEKERPIFPALARSGSLPKHRTRLIIECSATVEPPVSDHPSCEELVVPFESSTAGSILRGQVRTHLLFGENV